MAVQTFVRPYDYDPSVTKEAVVGEPHKIPASAPYHIFLRHVPRQQTPSTVKVSGGGITWTEVSTPPSASGQYRVRYDEALGRIEFHSSDAGKEITVDYNACGTVVWGEKHDDGRPNIAELQEVLERVQEAGGIDYGSSGFANVKAALDALVGARIVEMGSNSNGTYVWWENGLQLCYVRIGGLGPIDSQWGSLYTFASGVQWTFPAAFVSIPVVVAFPGSTSEFAAIAYQQTPLTSSFVRLSLARGTASNQTDFVIAAIAIGAWK